MSLIRTVITCVHNGEDMMPSSKQVQKHQLVVHILNHVSIYNYQKSQRVKSKVQDAVRFWFLWKAYT